MSTIKLDGSNLQDTIDNNAILAIDFWAPWCAPCRTFGPVFEKAAEKHTDIGFAKCNTQEQPGVAGAFGVRSIPTLAIFREQILVFMQPGALPPAALEEVLTWARGLDMEDVKAKLAEEEAKLAKEMAGSPAGSPAARKENKGKQPVRESGARA